ncbi:hypothetical protein PI124_g7415 [Phytophthora idaei]|nr:hypothetical protein PI124_g7415 [Phytophthora idaei]
MSDESDTMLLPDTDEAEEKDDLQDTANVGGKIQKFSMSTGCCAERFFLLQLSLPPGVKVLFIPTMKP